MRGFGSAARRQPAADGDLWRRSHSSILWASRRCAGIFAYARGAGVCVPDPHTWRRCQLQTAAGGAGRCVRGGGIHRAAVRSSVSASEAVGATDAQRGRDQAGLRAAVTAMRRESGAARMFLGGHSYGGRMASVWRRMNRAWSMHCCCFLIRCTRRVRPSSCGRSISRNCRLRHCSSRGSRQVWDYRGAGICVAVDLAH